MKCPVCASRDAAKGLEEFEEYTLHHCKNCDLMWWEPFKAGTREFYEKLHVLRDVCQFADELQFDHKTFLANPPIKQGDLLDVGCGTGVFLKEARKLGFRVTGIDIDQNAIVTAKTKYQIDDAHAMSLEEFSKRFEGRKFDVITCFQIIEHLDNIRDFFGLVKPMLKPAGFLVIGTPHRERWVRPRPMDLAKTGHVGDYPPMHLTRWNRKSLTYLLESEGFSDVEVVMSPFSLAEARSYITTNIGIIRDAEERFVALFRKSKVLKSAGDGNARVQTMSSVLRLARMLRRLAIFAPSVVVFACGRMLHKEGCILYARGKYVP